MEPEYVQCAISTAATTAIWRGSPLSTMSTLRVLPLGFNSSLEAMKVCTCAQLAWRQHIVVEAADYQQKIVTTNVSNQLQPILIYKSTMCTFLLSQCLNALTFHTTHPYKHEEQRETKTIAAVFWESRMERKKEGDVFDEHSEVERRRKIVTKTGR